MFRKGTRQRGRAQLAEALVLVLAAAWVSHVAQYAKSQTINGEVLLQMEQRLLQVATMSHVLYGFYILCFLAILSSLYRPQASHSLRMSCRNKHDSGLAVGCLLPPLVLLSRLLAEIYQVGSFSSFTCFYAWVSISIGFSALLKFVVFRSMTSLQINLLVDVVLLPIVFGVLSPTEASQRFLLATGARIAVAIVLAAGLTLLPRSFTIGEAVLVAQGIGLCAFDLVLVTTHRMRKQQLLQSVPKLFQAWFIFEIDRPKSVLALEVGMLGSLLVCVASISLLQSNGVSSPTKIAQPLSFHKSMQFILLATVVVGGVVYPWSCLLLQTWNPFAWLLDFLTEPSISGVMLVPPRLALIVYWISCLIILVPIVAFASKHFKLRNIVTRKYFHFLVVLMLGPPSFFDAPMLSLSYGVALSVFIIVECVRAMSLPPFGRSIASFMKSFIDSREAGRVILTHSYLLIGCALPLWLVPPPNPPSPLVMNAGVVALGIGDAMGAVVGSSVGKRMVFGTKTVEGSVAVFISIMIASGLLQNHRGIIGADYVQVVKLTCAVFLTTILEAATAQIDNLVLPLFFYSVCNLVECI
ncbi:hypothetical protein CCR75_006212 [Bremia lactucae]|uniref:dolichol kinase n=1 Tax=Bremia lactucae TaxID=4779 RepID=A0A976ID73_BRELC|nr:hypothetical protein CCR75_006212 [Bremia lactucae]